MNGRERKECRPEDAAGSPPPAVRLVWFCALAAMLLAALAAARFCSRPLTVRPGWPLRPAAGPVELVVSISGRAAEELETALYTVSCGGAERVEIQIRTADGRRTVRTAVYSIRPARYGRNWFETLPRPARGAG